MALECISKEECVSIDGKVRFCSLSLCLSFWSLDELGRTRVLTLSDQPLAFIDLESGMETQDCRIGFGVGG
ncbi:hypothetical protein C492_00090 [Natronococcus jeotgali DSM 18795]|uniref:Uncharacterized protein n=1 Tax=Natronococcus jeotgali DSM 18795 TaxID=1227498 RepID=L9Y136_9EURY|nr:hypothetical protein C492_00090 [Natronococcus jeotgali DSM 18795]